MAEAFKVVAIIAANPALSSILSMVLQVVPGLRVRHFESESALHTYMRLAPVDLIVGDFDCELARADEVAKALNTDNRLIKRDFQFIALARAITEQTRLAIANADIDEVIVKPMSPRHMVERVVSRLRDHQYRPTIAIAAQGSSRPISALARYQKAMSFFCSASAKYRACGSGVPRYPRQSRKTV